VGKTLRDNSYNLYSRNVHNTPVNTLFSIYFVHHTIMVIIDIIKMLNIILFCRKFIWIYQFNKNPWSDNHYRGTISAICIIIVIIIYNNIMYYCKLKTGISNYVSLILRPQLNVICIYFAFLFCYLTWSLLITN
jgi:hypothetical protein